MTNRERGPLSQLQHFSFGGGVSESADPNDQDQSTGQTVGNVGTSDVMGGRGALDRAMDFTAIGQLVGAMNRAGASTIAAGGPIEARGASVGGGYGGNAAASGIGMGGAGAGGNSDASAAPTIAPADPAAGGTPSSRYIPGTGDYEKIMIRHDGVRTDLQGRPLTYAAGGAVPGPGGEEGPPSGLFAGGTPGRSDLVDASLPEGSYVLPADTVSGEGEGNTEAGALSLAHQFTRSPLVKHETVVAGPIKARVSAGEFYVSPTDVKKAGGPGALDKMVKELRKHYTKHLTKLPDPKK